MPSVTFEADLTAPIPVFVSPPTQIVRTIPEDMSNSLENLAPTTQTMEILVQFPDGIQREITQLRLYINGAPLELIEQPPFDTVTFDLTPYQASGEIILRVEVTDELGLTGTSVDTPVDIVVQMPERGLFSLLGRNATLIIGGVVVLSGAVVFLVLVLAGRLRPLRIGERREKRQAARDPVTQPLPPETEKQAPKEEPTSEPQESVLERITQRLPSPRIQWPTRTRPTTDPYGHLVRVSEDGEPITKTLYPITVSELTFGSDTHQVVLFLDDPAVEPLHARLWRDDDGSFHIQDTGSTAGTWLNYAPVSEEGSRVEHGDLIHIAKIGYRITINKPARLRQTKITPLKTTDPPSEKE